MCNYVHLSEVRGQRSEVRGQRSEVADYAQNSYFLFVNLSFTKVLPTVQCEHILYDENNTNDHEKYVSFCMIFLIPSI